jgi:hypothetical protein
MRKILSTDFASQKSLMERGLNVDCVQVRCMNFDLLAPEGNSRDLGVVRVTLPGPIASSGADA